MRLSTGRSSRRYRRPTFAIATDPNLHGWPDEFRTFVTTGFLSGNHRGSAKSIDRLIRMIAEDPCMSMPAVYECAYYIFHQAQREFRKRAMARYRRTGRRHGR